MSILQAVVRGFLRGAERGMTSKRGNKNFYKGRGAKSSGTKTKRGGFVVQPHKIPELMVPDLTDFELKPYVSHKALKINPPIVTSEDLLTRLPINQEKSTV
ncbi:39S ribosomal protein L41, mitochondrial [Trichoplax sp. H2]|nr:39S ribosomal protein L41, mitochondrial [Trichoplax sp. H2]|eukprot:RDD44511.1 39S ribosomal protein L41, mitochondrial [Trichoplax sp. H2]